MKTAVLFDAKAPACARRGERLSELSAAAAAKTAAAALEAAGHEVFVLPARGSISGMARRMRAIGAEVAVNLCEGFAGNSAFEPHVAAVLEMLGLPFTGNSAGALALCLDKFRTKAVLAACGLPVPAGWSAQSAADVPPCAAYPLFVKPMQEDASIGIGPGAVVECEQALAGRIAWITQRYGQPALVEEYVGGREFNVAVVGGETARSLPVSEIEFRGYAPGEYRFVCYRAKWVRSAREYRRTAPVCPADIPPGLERELRILAGRAWRAAGLRGYARVDFRLNAGGRPVILELNPNPDVSPGSGFARALAAAGVTFRDFWVEQLKAALGGADAAGSSKVSVGRRNAGTAKKNMNSARAPCGGRFKSNPGEEQRYHANVATIA